MAVVAHHPVVVELEGITLRLLAVDEDAASVVYLQVVALVNLDAALVYSRFFSVRAMLSPFFGIQTGP